MQDHSPSWRIFLRHAHRELFDRSQDNGLSEKGHRQGRKIQEWMKQHAPKPEHIFSSPKLRCIETAEYVAELYGLKVQVVPELDEQHPNESDAAFRKRVAEFLNSEKCPPRSVFCTHGDVLPELARLLGLPGVDISKGDLFIERDGRVVGTNPVRA
jgi:broad specificity phosphatase PhoE